MGQPSKAGISVRLNRFLIELCTARSNGDDSETAKPEVRHSLTTPFSGSARWARLPGVLTSVEADARRWLDLGCQFMAVGVDASILARHSENLRARF